MNYRIKLTIVAVSITAMAGVAGMAAAGQGRHKGHHRGHMMKTMAERYDANKDGSLSQEEIDTNRTQWHGEFDGDKDGGLALQEFQALWLKARNVEMVREFQRFDRDGDGKVTLDEYKAPMASTVADMDRNGDGMLSRDDRRRGQRGRDAEEKKAN